MALTERQQQIKALQDQDKTPKEIAEALGITVNGIYQQLRRMKQGGGGGKAPAAKTTKVVKAPTPAPAPATPRGAEQVSNVPRPMTPLQAIRARKNAIESELKLLDGETVAAQKAFDAAKAKAVAAYEKRGEELKQLVDAEGVITGTMNASRKPTPKTDEQSAPAAPKAAKGKSNGKGSTPVAAKAVADMPPPDAAQGPAVSGPESVAIAGAGEPDPFAGGTEDPDGGDTAVV